VAEDERVSDEDVERVAVSVGGARKQREGKRKKEKAKMDQKEQGRPFFLFRFSFFLHSARLSRLY
jgi:hypothetical protein